MTATLQQHAEPKVGRVHELEALSPAERSRLLTAAIDEVMDVEAFNHEIDAEREDAAKIATLRDLAMPMIAAAARAAALGGAS